MRTASIVRRLRRAVAAFAAAAAPAASGLELDRLAFADDAAAAGAWRAVAPAPAARALAPRGVALPCPFAARAADRFAWDRAARLDLSPYTSLEVELECARPGALRSLYVYFQSGDGWYVFAAPLRKTGAQRLVFRRDRAGTEGRPAGWDRVSRIRVAAWRGAAADTELRLRSLAARRDPVVLVRATASAPEGAERRIASATTDRLGRWLADLDVPHGVLADEEATPEALADARLAILGYNPLLPDAEFAALRDFVARGGKLIVCYSGDARLAALLGVRLGAYVRAERPLQWAAFRFADAEAWGVPERVYQESANLRRAEPAAATTEVIAGWEGADGRPTGDAAWLAAPAGLWMTHVLQDGDAERKRHLLAALVARHVPELWPRITAPLLRDAGRIDSYAGFDDAAARIRAAAGGGAAAADTVRLLARAEAVRDEMRALAEAGRHPGVLAKSRELRAVLTEAYARVQAPVFGEFRAAWDHRGVGWYPGDWDRTAARLAADGFTAVFPNVLWPAAAHYPSDVVPRSAVHRLYGDALADCVRAGRAHGLEVHAWAVCWNLGTAGADVAERLRREGRLQRDAAGATRPWLCPAHPSNRALLLDALREMATRYAVAGVHLDYLRYADRECCVCPASRAAFEAALGRRVEPWPSAVRPGGAARAEFERWRAADLSAFLRDARGVLAAARPGARLSAAVFPGYPDCVGTVGQDWAAWLREGLVDFVCPMTYTENLADFESRTARHLAAAGAAAGRVYPGIGVTANESQLAPDQVIEQVLAARRQGARGWAVFDLDLEMRENVLPALRLGVTRGR